MSWKCPVCSSINEDSLGECFVCGTTKVVGYTKDSKASDRSCTVVYSVFEYLSSYFRNKPKKKADGYVKKKASKAKTDSVKIEKKRGDSFSPWEGHSISIDYDVLKEKGYKQIEKSEMSGIKGYKLIKNDGNCQFVKKEMLIIQRIAKKV